MMSPKRVGVLAFAVLVAFPLASARGATIMVEQTVDSVGPADENCSLRNAIIATNQNADFGGCIATGSYNLATPDTIILDALTYQLTRCPDADPDPTYGDLDIMGALTIQGAGSQLSVIDASPLNASRGTDCRDRVFDIHIEEAPDPNDFSPAVEFQDLMIVGGYAASGDGGGVQSVNGSDPDNGASIHPIVTLRRVQVGFPPARGTFAGNVADRDAGDAHSKRHLLTDRHCHRDRNRDCKQHGDTDDPVSRRNASRLAVPVSAGGRPTPRRVARSSTTRVASEDQGFGAEALRKGPIRHARNDRSWNPVIPDPDAGLRPMRPRPFRPAPSLRLCRSMARNLLSTSRGASGVSGTFVTEDGHGFNSA